MTSERPSTKLLVLLGLCVVLAGGVYGRSLLGGDGTRPEPDPIPESLAFTTEPVVGTVDPVPWTLPDQPRDPFQAVPLGP